MQESNLRMSMWPKACKSGCGEIEFFSSFKTTSPVFYLQFKLHCLGASAAMTLFFWLLHGLRNKGEMKDL